MGSMLDKREAIRPLMHLMLGVLLHITSIMMVVPVLTDVVLEALCPGESECSQAIYLTGVQQVVTGIGTMLVTPILGELSDDYGRKPLLMIPFGAAMLPMGVLAYSRSKPFVYLYIIISTVVRMVSEGAITCLTFAYVGDTVEEGYRALGIGVLMASFSSGYVLGILAARVLPESQIFRIAALLAAAAAIYLKLFLVDSNQDHLRSLLPRQLIKKNRQRTQPLLLRSTSSISETLLLVKNSKLLTQIAVIVFFSNLGEAAVQSSLMYYLKATFGFAKDQFAELMLISGIAAVISQLMLMPMFIHYLGEKVVLCLGLFAAFIHALLYGIAWAPWVPYVCSSMSVLFVFVFPCIGSMVSKAAGPEEQGKLQGFIAGVRSFAAIISPLAISPLTALFLSEEAPFYCPGFSIICAAFAMVVALIQGSIMLPIQSQILNYKPSKYVQVVSEDVAAEP